MDRYHAMQGEVAEWRRHLHRNPEIGFDLEETAAFVTAQLTSFGINHIETGIAKSGIVAVIQGKGGDGPTIGLRADMDALPILEASGKPWASGVAGKMHGCGHDGHTAMLLGAAKCLAEERDFRGAVALIFQPAEEILPSGALKMIQEGIMERFGISRVFSMHNSPGLPVGSFAIRPGPILASLDEFDLIIRGRGGHAARPSETVDPIPIAGQVLCSLQTLVSRNADPIEALVMSITQIHAGTAYNIIPDHAELAGTVRTYSPALQDLAERRILEIARGVARASGGDAELDYRRDTPVTFNHAEETGLAIRAAAALVGPGAVNDQMRPRMGTEDFAHMLKVRPGALIYLGNGSTPLLHNPGYDFNDEALPYGIGYWVHLVKAALPA
ncbi:M20 family metallopeptidase [Siccirubricoccus sp. KC 17139]|uniref:M20 family metallopeptidase n=1 Tax=Siccirubricoccus soli TaxID=2899147 RepID=A0ABT1DF49_9PROT|nr:M20 aminoacylase family protein [Siccirubricoccus soli]MCO6419834.1 M20 family metallopeptidase [Siccirubricoccus soli]MCP2685969.1 M20 family metallopeptidase [Siccirubricoccus soli]